MDQGDHPPASTLNHRAVEFVPEAARTCPNLGHKQHKLVQEKLPVQEVQRNSFRENSPRGEHGNVALCGRRHRKGKQRGGALQSKWGTNRRGDRHGATAASRSLTRRSVSVEDCGRQDRGAHPGDASTSSSRRRAGRSSKGRDVRDLEVSLRVHGVSQQTVRRRKGHRPRGKNPSAKNPATAPEEDEVGSHDSLTWSLTSLPFPTDTTSSSSIGAIEPFPALSTSPDLTSEQVIDYAALAVRLHSEASREVVSGRYKDVDNKERESGGEGLRLAVLRLGTSRDEIGGGNGGEDGRTRERNEESTAPATGIRDINGNPGPIPITFKGKPTSVASNIEREGKEGTRVYWKLGGEEASRGIADSASISPKEGIARLPLSPDDTHATKHEEGGTGSNGHATAVAVESTPTGEGAGVEEEEEGHTPLIIHPWGRPASAALKARLRERWFRLDAARKANQQKEEEEHLLMEAEDRPAHMPCDVGHEANAGVIVATEPKAVRHTSAMGVPVGPGAGGAHSGAEVAAAAPLTSTSETESSEGPDVGVCSFDGEEKGGDKAGARQLPQPTTAEAEG
ncbi:unnamed protein product, partial [Discosporangium mesarthrocarpum]